MLLQTPEAIEKKEEEAREDIGKHLMIGLRCKDGWVFGKPRVNRIGGQSYRENRPPPWLSVYDESENPIFVLTVGDFGDMQSFHPGINNEQNIMADWVTSRYVTEEFTAKIARALMREKYRESTHLFGLAAVVGSLRDGEYCHLVNYDGEWRRFAHFVVAGASMNTEECQTAKQNAIEFLREKWGEYQSGHCLTDGKKAIPFLIEVFEKFDPPGRTNVLDIVDISGKDSDSPGRFLVREAELDR